MTAFVLVDRLTGEHENQFLYSTAKKALKYNGGYWRRAVIEVSFGKDKKMDIVPESVLSEDDFNAGINECVAKSQDMLDFVSTYHNAKMRRDSIATCEREIERFKAIKYTDLLYK